MQTKDKIFYGWVIVAGSLTIICFFFGIRFSFGIFFKSLQAEYDLTRAATSGVFSVYMVFSAAFSFISGWALDRYGPKIIVGLMGLFTGLSLLVTSQVTSSWQLFLSYSLLLAMGTAGTRPVLISGVSRWFDRKRGVAIGITTSGTGLGTLIMAPTTAYLISNLGWRMSYIVMGLVTWFIVISVAMLLKRDPSEIGALPDGAKSVTGGTASIGEGKMAKRPSFSLRQALGTRTFWLLVPAWSLWAVCLSLILTHTVPHATDLGISTMEASTILSVMSIFSILSRLLIGRASDLMGRKLPGVVCALLGAVALTWLIWADNLWMFYVFAVIFGFCWGGVAVINFALVGDSFGGRNLGVIMGVLNMGFAVGLAAGSALGGFVFDVTGSYAVAFTTGAVALGVIALVLALTGRELNTGTG